MMSDLTVMTPSSDATNGKAVGLRSSRGLALLLGISLVAVVALVASPALAGIKEWALGAVGWLVMIIIQFLGWLILKVVPVLVGLAGYNTFVTHNAVGVGWTVTRDVVNMFFVLVLLLMAFGTMLGFSNWTARGGKLVNLLIMAVLVNFSRTICGILIDMGQVIMLTFVSGFKEAAGGNFLEALKLTDVLQQAKAGEGEIGNIVASLIMAMVMTAIALFVLVMMTIALAVRIVQLWLLIVISPIAFFLRGAPVASNYYGEWWKQFSSTVIVGPLLAFFLWLALVSVQQSNGDILQGKAQFGATGESYVSDSMSSLFDDTKIAQFIIAVALLLMGYKLANQLAGQTMGAATKIRQMGAAAGRWTARQGVRGTLGLASVATPNYVKERARATYQNVTEGLAKVPLLRKLTAEGRETDRLKAREKAQSAAGRTVEARSVAQELQKRQLHQVRNKKSDDLWKTANDENGDDRNRQTAMLALAQRKDDSVYGQGEKNNSLIEALSKGNKDFGLTLRTTLKEMGDDKAFNGFTEPTGDKYTKEFAASDKKKLDDIIARLPKLQLDARRDGQLKGDDLEAYLAMQGDQFAKLNDRNKEKVSDQLLSAIAALKDSNPDKAKAAADKHFELVGKQLTSVDQATYAGMKPDQKRRHLDQLVVGADMQRAVGNTAQSDDLLDNYGDVTFDRSIGLNAVHPDRQRARVIESDIEYAVGKKRMAAVAERAVDKTDMDKVNDHNLAGSRAARRETKERTEELRRVRDDVVKNGVTPGTEAAIIAVMSKLQDLVQNRRPPAGAKDKSGNLLNNQGAFDATQLAADLRSAAKSPDAQLAAAKLLSAVSRMENATKTVKPTDRPAITDVKERGIRSLQAAADALAKVKDVADPSRRKASAKSAADKVTSSLSIIMKNEPTLPDPVKAEIATLRRDLKALRKADEIGAAETAALDAIYTRLNELKRRS